MEKVLRTDHSEPPPDRRQVTPEDVQNQVDSILKSEVLRTAQLLRNLLAYLCRQYAQDSSVPVSEHELATSVFERRSDFDSREDSVVRVHTGRLRSKLAEYYMTEGKFDTVLLEIPKGHYYLIAHRRQQGADHNVPLAEPPCESTLISIPSSKVSGWRRMVLFVLAGIALIAVGAVIGRIVRLEGPPPALSTFWGGFTSPSAPTLVIFSNPRFVGSSSKGLRLFREGIDSSEAINETYAGTGEVIAVHDLDVAFSTLNRSLVVKRSQLLTWDEVQGRNLIFLGSPAQNLPTGEVRIEGFHFALQGQENVLVNEKPATGEPDSFVGSGPPYTSGYALVAYTDSPNHVNSALVLGGTNTFGTQGAAELVTRESKVSELLRALHIRPGQTVPYFVAVLEVKVTGGAVVESHMVLVRAKSKPTP